jgi:ribonuclease HII
MPPGKRAMPGINDSKRLSAKQREQVIGKILTNALSVGIGAASVREIDRLNILQASVLAVRRALKRLKVTPDHIVVDGKSVRTYDFKHTAIIKGDSRCYSIACASIVAKITRDRVMHALASRYPVYNWAENSGYATAIHLKSIADHGITRHHRKSFMPVSQISLDFSASTENTLSIAVNAATDDVIQDTV